MTEKILKAVNNCGVRDCGIIPFSSSLLLQSSRKLSLFPKNSKSVIVCVFPYFIGDDASRNISLYAVSRDYHVILKKYLERICKELSREFSGYSFVGFADSSPVKEVYAAAKAGLGVIGVNNTLITKKYGSYVFIGEIVTDLEIYCEEKEALGCEGCLRCISACPSCALRENGIDISRCLSGLTQKKGDFTAEELELFNKGKLLWGCDCCQQACPHNMTAEKTYIPEFFVDVKFNLTEENVLEGFDGRAYSWRRENVILRNLKLFEDK